MPDKTQLRLIRGVFLRLMISSVLVTMTTCACGLIDNMFKVLRSVRPFMDKWYPDRRGEGSGDRELL